MKKTFAVIIVIAVLLGGGFLYLRYQNAQAKTTTTYQTVELAMGDLSAVVGATGTVRANQTTTVNWQASGRIGKIAVKEGDKVSINQLLAELDPASLPQNLISARSDLVTAQRSLDNLKNSDVAMAQAQQALAQAQKNLKDAQDNRYRKNLARVTQATIDQAKSDLIISQDSLKKAQDNFKKFDTWDENDVQRAQAFSRVAAAQQKVDQNQWNLDWLLSLPDTLEISQADADIVVAQAKLKDAQREMDRLKSGADPQDLAAAQARIESIQATLALTALKSPIAGTVTDIKSMLGDQVNSGTVSFRLDDLSRLLVDVSVPEVDINRIKPGQPAKLTFDAITGKEYNGKVVEMTPFGTTTNGVVNFTVTVELTDHDAQIRPGMTAAVNITVQQLTSILLVPNRAVRLQDGKRVVYILEEGKPKAVEITLGATNDTNTQVTGGQVKAGDSVVLNPPAALKAPTGGSGFGAMFSAGGR